jgi:hypothetical protein
MTWDFALKLLGVQISLVGDTAECEVIFALELILTLFVFARCPESSRVSAWAHRPHN